MLEEHFYCRSLFGQIIMTETLAQMSRINKLQLFLVFPLSKLIIAMTTRNYLASDTR